MKMIKKALGFENRMVDWEATDLSDIRYFMMKSLNQKASIGFKLWIKKSWLIPRMI